jgi:preprotein translocase subunit SecG
MLTRLRAGSLVLGLIAAKGPSEAMPRMTIIEITAFILAIFTLPSSWVASVQAQKIEGETFGAAAGLFICSPVLRAN